MLTHAHSKIVYASPGRSSHICHQNALTERAWKDAVQGLGNTNISIAAFKVKSRLNRSVPLFVMQTWMATLLNWLARKKLPQNHSLSLYHCNLFSGGGHDTILSQITCEKVRIWTSFWLDRKKYGWFALFRLAKMPPSISCCWFQSASLLAQWAVNTR